MKQLKRTVSVADVWDTWTHKVSEGHLPLTMSASGSHPETSSLLQKAWTSLLGFRNFSQFSLLDLFFSPWYLQLLSETHYLQLQLLFVLSSKCFTMWLSWLIGEKHFHHIFYIEFNKSISLCKHLQRILHCITSVMYV